MTTPSLKCLRVILLGMLAGLTLASQGFADEEHWSRTFGSVMHLAVLRGAEGVDMKGQVLASLLASTPGSSSNADSGIEVQAFWPLDSAHENEELIWAERYNDLREWTEAEMTAQRSPKWITNQVKLLRSGTLQSFYSEMMVEDSLSETARLRPKKDDPPIAVHWMQLKSDSILPNLTVLPKLVLDLETLLKAAGYTDAVIKYYAAPTSAGSDRENAWIWIEYPNAERMIAAQSLMTSNSELRAWRQQLVKATHIVRHWNLIQAK